MIIPIKCFTCGNVLASKYDAYLQLMNAKQVKLKDNKEVLFNNEDNSGNIEIITIPKRQQRLQEFIEKKSKDKPIEALILDKVGLEKLLLSQTFIGSCKYIVILY